MTIKVGEKDYPVLITNRVIYDIEEAFNNVPIYRIMDDAETLKLTLKQIGLVLFNTIKHNDITWEDFIDNMKLNQYEAANKEVYPAIMKSFDTGSKKK